MKLEYHYRIGPAGIEFSLVEDADAGIEMEGTPEQRMTVERYVMLAWQEAINKTFRPEEIRELMATPEGQRRLQEGAEVYLARLLEDFPPELDRRKTPDRRDWSKRPRDGTTDRRRIGRKPAH